MSNYTEDGCEKKWKWINPMQFGFGERPFVPPLPKEKEAEALYWLRKSIEKSEKLLQQRLREEAENNNDE